MRRVVITGINGYIGQYLYTCRPNNIELEGSVREIDPAFVSYFNPHIKLHVLNLKKGLYPQLRRINADIIIHTAAMAHLSACQKNPEPARQINAMATESLAKWCGQNSTRIVYLSTDIVFDGQHPPYSEDDIPNPINEYGLTKLQGEQAIQSHVEDHAIIRIALAIGRGKFNRKNFVDWMIDKIKKREEIPLFIDEFRTASAVSYLVKNIWLIALSADKGIFHQFGASRLCRYDIGKLICKDLNSGIDLIRPVKAAKMEDYPRPLDVSLTTKRTVDEKKLILPGIEKVIKDIL